MLTQADMIVILDDINVPEFEFKLHLDHDYHLNHGQNVSDYSPAEERFYLQGHYTEKDITTQVLEPQATRKWLLSKHMTKSELVQTAFKCYLTSMEHQARESFRYRERLIFGPHYDVDVLHSICKDKNLDYRRDSQSIASGRPILKDNGGSMKDIMKRAFPPEAREDE